MIYKPIQRHNSISTILSIVLVINGVYTKITKFHYRHVYRSSRIGPITTTFGLPIVCDYSTHCPKYISFTIKISINGHWILDFSVCSCQIQPFVGLEIFWSRGCYSDSNPDAKGKWEKHTVTRLARVFSEYTTDVSPQLGKQKTHV